MTIVVNFTVPEGLVFAADSRQTYVNRAGDTRVSSDYGVKLFQLGPRIAAVTFGWAFLDGRSIHSHVQEFRVALGGGDLPVEEVTKRLGAYLTERYTRHVDSKMSKPVDEGSYALGFLVGGYDPGDKQGKMFEMYVPDGECFLRRTTNESPGAAWRGFTYTISRLLNGYDPRLTSLKSFPEDLRKELDEYPLSYNIDYWGMTLQDAVDFALFLTQSTIQMQRFSDGIGMDPGASANCGGPIDLLVIDPMDGLRWIQRKQLGVEMPRFVVGRSET